MKRPQQQQPATIDSKSGDLKEIYTDSNLRDVKCETDQFVRFIFAWTTQILQSHIQIIEYLRKCVRLLTNTNRSFDISDNQHNGITEFRVNTIIASSGQLFYY